MRRPLALAAASVALAGGLLLLGIPRVASGIVSLPGNRIIGDLRYDRPVSTADFAILMRSRERALLWFEDRGAWSDVGLAHLLAAGDPALDDTARRGKLEAAVEAIRHGLSLAPGDGYVWARLAIALYDLDGPTAAVADALTQSLLITEFDRRLVFDRLDVAFAVWNLLTPDMRGLFLRQVGYAFDVSPKRLGEVATSPERRVRIVAALAETPERMKRFENYMRRIGR